MQPLNSQADVIKPRRHHALPIGLLLVMSAVGCGDLTLPDEGEAAKIEVVSGNQQQGPAGSVLPQQLVVKVTDTRSRPVVGQDVAFSVETGGGSAEPATVKTGADGQAAASWTLGASAGGQLLRARTARGGSTTPLEVSFSATAVAGTGSNLSEVSGDEQSGPVNSALADSLVVRVTDALGNPVAGVEVAWTVSGGGSISPTAVVTGPDGLAAAERVLGPTAGAQSAQAAVEGFTGSPVGFTHTAVPANPTALVLVSGDNQIGPGGFALAESLVVRLEDNNGNGIGARPITWVVPAGSGSVTPVSTTTDANGLAITRWTLPASVGSFSVSAVFSGLPAVPFSATATADVPTTIELVSGDNQSASVGSTLPNPLVVRVTDANDIPVANVGVSWEAQVGGSVSAGSSATNASGLAQVNRTLGVLPGSYTTTATVDGLTGSPITFTSTATVGSAAKLAIITQPGTTTATSGQALVPQPEIEVQDALGNPILQAGRTVSASITSSPEDPTGPGSATLNGANDQTNGSGRTTYTGLRITGPAGSYVLTFSSGALTPVSSATVTLGAGSANRIVILQQPSSSVINGTVFPQQPIVQIRDGAGNPVPTAGFVIAASIQDGQPELGPAAIVNATTDGTGTATFSGLRITGVVGNRTLGFSRPGLVGVESNQISVTAGPPSSLAKVDGDNQTAPVNTAVATDPSVRVTDVSGNPISGVEVEFEVTVGSVVPETVTTGSDGVAEVDSWTLGPSAGANTLVASVPSAPGLGTETFNATATAVNQAPAAQADNYSVDEDATLNVDANSGVLANDDDPDNDDLTAILVAGPANDQNFSLNSDGSFTYTPDPDFNGSDSFTYQAFDGQASSSTVTVTITVNPVNDDPGFSAGPDIEVSALGSVLGFTDEGWATGISPGPPNEGAQTVSFQVSTDNPGAFSVSPSVDPAGTLTFTPALTLAQLVVTGTIIAEDSDGGTSESQNFSITINP